MERIKEAVEKAKRAREQQQGLAQQTVPEPQGQPVDGVTAPAGEAAAPAMDQSTTKPITYKSTRVEQLDYRLLENNRIISFEKADERTVSFDRLRTRLLQVMEENGWRTLAITSPTAACGKSTIALNLCLSIAHQEERTVLLADLDLRSPRLHQYMGLPDGPSLVDYLAGDIPLQDVFVNPGVPRLTLLPTSHPATNTAELIMTRRMQDLVKDIRERYQKRLVIFDLPSLLTTDDALAFLPHVDCVLLVCAAGQTTKSEIRSALRLLQNVPIAGTVLNKADTGVTI